MTLYRFISNNILFKFDPEFIHDCMQVILSNKIAPYLTSLYSTSNNHISKTYIMGKELNSPLALAAGFDKNCAILKALDKLGFGYIVGGTVTINPRPGNLKPRITRYVHNNSMVNSLGFPNLGVGKIIENLSKYDLKTPLIMSISGDSISDITELYKLLSDYCFGFEINISSPNTEKLKYFHDYHNFEDLIKSLNGIKNKPYMIKLPRLEISDLDQKAKLLYEKYFQILLDYKVDGLVLSNTFPVEDDILKTGKGGLSGKPLYQNTKDLISFASQFFNGKLDIVASGGISTSDEVKELICEGAKGIQLWTSLIYEGPNLIKRINKELLCE